ncbi:fringe glycosyltransferase-like [Limulus polyphemus]|uniref:Fringe glycosyltransferase-like n=1 Tax=Limulus polyphemus TaxID=6850 RepID=A0ABM1SII3_LIMPO|nr:fringe glycosyltransferase-like [Limulus polyphemus]
MRISLRKLLQLAAGIALVLFTRSLFVVWLGDTTRHSNTSPAAALVGLLMRKSAVGKPLEATNFQERVPRSVADSDFKEFEIENNFSYPLTELNDIFFSVKTTKIYHASRLDVIFRTWFILARDQTFFFTDGDDSFYQAKTNGHLINTNCSSSHNRKALCCKMSVEFDTFLESGKKWFCHFDDDNYVNVPRLVKLLQMYNPQEDWYLGKPSIRAPLEILNREKNSRQKIAFWFATGGAGFCISRALALKMMPFASGGKFISISEKIRLPDDVTMGYIIEFLLKKKLTVVHQFHSHLEPMKIMKPENYQDQVRILFNFFSCCHLPRMLKYLNCKHVLYFNILVI